MLLQEDTYQEWVAEFHPGSYAEGGWDEGCTVLFKTPEGNGLISRVKVHKPAQEIVFLHTGVLSKGKEHRESAESKKWIGIEETYMVSEQDGVTQFSVRAGIEQSYKEWFEEAWAKALAKLKMLCEQ